MEEQTVKTILPTSPHSQLFHLYSTSGKKKKNSVISDVAPSDISEKYIREDILL